MIKRHTYRDSERYTYCSCPLDAAPEDDGVDVNGTEPEGVILSVASEGELDSIKQCFDFS